MSNSFNSNSNIALFEKIKKIENINDLLTELFSDNLNNTQEPSIKYFILNLFLQRKIKITLNEAWKLFKVLLSINPNIIKEKSETNELYALSLKGCINLLLKELMNLNLEQNFGFKNKDISMMFDFIFSLPIIKHFINFVDSDKQKKEIYDLLNQIGEMIFEKIKVGKNNIIKNMFKGFNHFLQLNEINTKSNKIINNENKNSQIMSQVRNSNMLETNLEKKKSTMIGENNPINNENTNIINKDNIIKEPFKNYSSNNVPIKYNQNNEIISQIPTINITKEKKVIKNSNEQPEESKIKNMKNNEQNIVNKNNNNLNNINSIPNSIALIYTKNVNEEIKIFKKYTKDLVEKVNSFINYEEMKKSIKEKLPGNCLLQIGSYLYTTPYPDPTNINVDLLIQKQNSGSYNIKKYFDTFETFKNISNTKSSFFCLNKDQYFYDCLEKNKSFFHLTRTDMDENTIQSVYNFKTVTVHLYAYNMIYGYSSFFIKKLYSTVKNLWKLHLFYEIILLKQFPILKSNYELSLLILNFLHINYKVFSEKKEDKRFTYFAYDRSKKYGFLTNYPLVMQYKTLYFFEYDEDRMSYIKQISVLELAKEFHKFLCKYFEYIYNDGKLFDNKNELNFSKENYFLDIKYIFNRYFLDQNLICYKNNSTDEFIKIKNLFSTISLE